jgi:hypothetical protein
VDQRLPTLEETLQDSLNLLRNFQQSPSQKLLLARLEFRLLFLVLHRSSCPVFPWDLERFRILQDELSPSPNLNPSSHKLSLSLSPSSNQLLSRYRLWRQDQEARRSPEQSQESSQD